MRGWMMMGVAAVALLVMTGCDTTKAPGAAGPDPLPEGAYPQVAALEGLGDYMSSGRAVVERGDDEAPMSVEVAVRLRSDKSVSAQYRFIFFDDRGTPLRPIMQWRFEPLPPRSQVYLKGQATDPAAVDWRLEIRPAH
ncbi:MAG: YcfL family protein [Phycisphaeraceae bacterium]